MTASNTYSNVTGSTSYILKPITQQLVNVCLGFNIRYARTRVQSGQRSNRATNPSGGQSSGVIHDGSIVSTLSKKYKSKYNDIKRYFYARVVEIPDLIVNMPHKYVGNNMRRETIDNLIEQVRPIRKRIGSIPAYNEYMVVRRRTIMQQINGEEPGRTCPRIQTL